MDKMKCSVLETGQSVVGPQFIDKKIQAQKSSITEADGKATRLPGFCFSVQPCLGSSSMMGVCHGAESRHLGTVQETKTLRTIFFFHARGLSDLKS